MSRQAMQQALEALEILDGVMRRSQRTDAAITALKQALAEPEQEPVPWEQFYPDIGKPQTTHWEGCEAVHPECRKPEPIQVSPTTFIQTVLYKEDTIGRPTIWAQWPNEEKNT